MAEIPKAAKQQGKAADELIKQLNAQPNDTPVDTAIPSPAAAQPVSQQEVQPPTTVKEGDDELTRLRGENEHLRQSYASLQGKYRKEVPTLAGQVRELKASLDALRNAQQTQAAAAPAFNSEAIASEYGDDVAAIAKSAEASARRVAELEAAETARQEAAATHAQDLVQQDFNQQIDELIPNFWGEKNNDPEWIAFLNTYTNSGETWMEKANREMATRNANGVKAIYDVFEASRKAPAASPSPEQPAPSQVQDPREALVPPKTTGHGEGQDKKVWTKAAISELYAEKDKLSRGQKSQFTPQELEEQERDFFAAQTDGSGRYQPNL